MIYGSTLTYLLVPTNRGELRGTEGTRDVIHARWREDLTVAALSSSFSPFLICYILSSCSHTSTSSLEERDRGRRGRRRGEDGFAIDCREKGKGTDIDLFSLEDIVTTNTTASLV